MAKPSKQVDRIVAIWNEHLETAKSLPNLALDVSNAVDTVCASLSAGGQLYIAGNGGSAADAQHIAAELTGRFLRDRKPLRALALHGNTSALTAIGNDYGYEQIFARELLAHARPGDVLLVMGSFFLFLITAVFCGFYVLPFLWAACLGTLATLLSGVYSVRVLVTLISWDQIPSPIRRLLLGFGYTPSGSARVV